MPAALALKCAVFFRIIDCVCAVHLPGKNPVPGERVLLLSVLLPPGPPPASMLGVLVALETLRFPTLLHLLSELAPTVFLSTTWKQVLPSFTLLRTCSQHYLLISLIFFHCHLLSNGYHYALNISAKYITLSDRCGLCCWKEPTMC